MRAPDPHPPALHQHQTLPALFDAQAAARAQAPALLCDGATLTHGELAARSRALAAALARAGLVRAGDRVAWLGLAHPLQVVLLLALARLGAALVPLNFRLAPPEWERLLRHARPTLLAHDATWAEAGQALAARAGLPALHAQALADMAADSHGEGAAEGGGEGDGDGAGAATPAHAQLASPALLVYTSGTTAEPKGALHTQANLLANIRAAVAVQQLTPADRVLTVLPLFHVGGLCIQTLPALAAGAQVLLQPRFSPEATLAALRDWRPTLTLQVPATMKALTEHPGWPAADLSCLRAVWAGSSLLPASLVEAFHARGVPVCNVYGATETGPFSVALPPARAMDHVGSCGWPAPGVELRLATPTGEEAAEEGEVWLRAPNVIERYWPDLPARDAGGWFHTGDLARRAPGGSLRIVGRAKELIISGGENIHPAEIEDALASHPAVLECAAFGVPDAQWGEAVAVAVVLREGVGSGSGEAAAPVTDEDLAAHLAARIARYKLPRRWLRVAALPRTALGKLQRHALAGLAAQPGEVLPKT